MASGLTPVHFEEAKFRAVREFPMLVRGVREGRGVHLGADVIYAESRVPRWSAC
jgi:hypothetical protein